MRRAKIVATFGPAVSGYDTTLAVLKAGVDVARMNMSHDERHVHQQTYDVDVARMNMSHDERHVHQQTYDNVRRAAAKLGKPVGIFADLQGPKIWLGRFTDGPHYLETGSRFTITIADIAGTAEICSTTFAGLPQDVNVGDALLIDDGKVALKAIEVDDVKVVTEVTIPGPVSNNKGINRGGRQRACPQHKG